jgi:hypothetical protein
MLYRVVLIFPDTVSLADFVEYLKTPGEVDGREHTFVGNLSEEQIKTARLGFDAYVRVMKEIT